MQRNGFEENATPTAAVVAERELSNNFNLKRNEGKITTDTERRRRKTNTTNKHEND